MALSSDKYWAMQSRPIKVHFAGWESDTYCLGRAGWKMAHEADPRWRHDRFMFHHERAALTATGMLKDPYRYRDIANRPYIPEDHDEGCIVIEHMASVGRFPVQMVDWNFRLSGYRLADTDPVMRQGTQAELHSMPLFAELFTNRPETQELIVEPEDVQQLLDKIVRLQAPGMREIRARDRKRESQEERGAAVNKQVHAQIITLKAA